MAPGQAKDAELTTQQKLIMGLYDVNGIPQEELEEICTARGACFETLAWFRKTTRVVDATTRSDIDLPSVYFVCITQSLLRYKYAAEVNSIQAVGGCLLEPLQVQLEAALELNQQSHVLWTSQAAGSWLDEELRDAKNVEVDDNARPQEAASALEEGEVEDLCFDAEEGEVSNVPDRRVDVKVARLPPVCTTSSSKWRSELLGVEDKQNLIITLTTHKFSPPKMGHTKWKTTGETSRDQAYTAAVHIRKASKAVGIKDHFMDNSSF
ncbi:hypothetical protein CPB83DRAFT_151740 [Crepidotus variabilis]|uniref:Uncharacterized protein n=1 Tax=Crepidotus variabilis TaxID=179855 RepID=A0A9P6E3R2_9AGAR|nr:hypothetical protein CPB83DRAFT_151740 [Crepidotus variabilis]